MYRQFNILLNRCSSCSLCSTPQLSTNNFSFLLPKFLSQAVSHCPRLAIYISSRPSQLLQSYSFIIDSRKRGNLYTKLVVCNHLRYPATSNKVNLSRFGHHRQQQCFLQHQHPEHRFLSAVYIHQVQPHHHHKCHMSYQKQTLITLNTKYLSLSFS